MTRFIRHVRHASLRSRGRSLFPPLPPIAATALVLNFALSLCPRKAGPSAHDFPSKATPNAGKIFFMRSVLGISSIHAMAAVMASLSGNTFKVTHNGRTRRCYPAGLTACLALRAGTGRHGCRLQPDEVIALLEVLPLVKGRQLSADVLQQKAEPAATILPWVVGIDQRHWHTVVQAGNPAVFVDLLAKVRLRPRLICRDWSMVFRRLGHGPHCQLPAAARRG